MKPDDRQLADKLADSAEKLNGIDAPSPDFQYFKALVDRQQEALRQAQRRQLALFIVVAAVLVSALMVCLGRFEILFIALQTAAFMGAVAGLAFFFIRKPREGTSVR